MDQPIEPVILPAPRSRPSWTNYFLGLAFIASRRSPDPSTQHGCVLVDRFNHVVGMGYNGFPRGVNDREMPLTRPEKYDWVVHAEENAVANATINTREAGDVTAYVTGRICFQCAKKLVQAGVTRWVMANRRGFHAPNFQDEANFKRLVAETGVSISWVEPDLRWMVEASFLTDAGILNSESDATFL